MSDRSGWGPSGPYMGPPGGWGWAPPPPPPPRPGVIPLAPLGLDSIFGGAFATLRRCAKPLFGLAFIAYGVLGAVMAGAAAIAYEAVHDQLDRIYFSSEDPRWSDIRAVLLAYAVVAAFGAVALMITTAFTQATCAATLHDAVLGRRATLRSVWRRARPRIPPVMGVTLLLGLLLLVPLLLYVAVAASFVVLLLHDSPAPLAVSVLLLLATFPLTVWLYVRFSFAPAVAVLEEARPVRAMRRSARLVRNAWWRTFGITLLGAATAAGVSMVVRLPLAFATMPSPSYDSSAEPHSLADAFAQALPDPGVTAVIGLVAALLVQVFAAVFLPLITTLLYIDQRIRKEGLADTLLRSAQQ